MFGIPYHAVFDPLGNENVPDVTRSFYPSEQTEAPTSAARWCPASSVMGCQQWGLFQKQRWWMCEIFKPADVTWMTSLWEMDSDWLETFRKRSPIGWATWENQLGSPAHHVEQMVIKELVLVQDFTLGWCNNVALPHVYSPLSTSASWHMVEIVDQSKFWQSKWCWGGRVSISQIVCPLAEAGDFKNVAYTSRGLC